MIDKINKAIDKGWRLREAGPPGVWCLVPPEAIEADLGLSVEGASIFKLIIPDKEITDWLEARVTFTPDEKKRHDKKMKVVNWMMAEWNGYKTECNDDEVYAKEIITLDASSDFKEPLDDVREWFNEACPR